MTERFIIKNWSIVMAVVVAISSIGVAFYRIEDQSKQMEDMIDKQEEMIEDIAYIRGKIEWCCDTGSYSIGREDISYLGNTNGQTSSSTSD